MSAFRFDRLPQVILQLRPLLGDGPPLHQGGQLASHGVEQRPLLAEERPLVRFGLDLRVRHLHRAPRTPPDDDRRRLPRLRGFEAGRGVGPRVEGDESGSLVKVNSRNPRIVRAVSSR